MDDAVTVRGLEAICPSDRGELRVWRPNSPGMQPEPEMLTLELRYQNQDYHARLMRTVEGVRRLGETDEEELRRFAQWFKTTPGWFVIVSGPGGKFSSSPYPTLEAAIIGVLSIPAVLWKRHQKGEIEIRAVEPADRAWILAFLQSRWGSVRMVVNGRMVYPAELPGFVASLRGEPTGLLSYELQGDTCEIILLDSGMKRSGLGSALVAAVRGVALAAGCTRLRVVTTNDNLDALRFYQRRGFFLAALRPNALEAARRLKPEIPPVGDFGIPLRDELELEMDLTEHP